MVANNPAINAQIDCVEAAADFDSAGETLDTLALALEAGLRVGSSRDWFRGAVGCATRSSSYCSQYPVC